MFPAFAFLLSAFQPPDVSSPEATVRGLIDGINRWNPSLMGKYVLGANTTETRLTGAPFKVAITKFFTAPDGDDTLAAVLVQIWREGPNQPPYKILYADVLRLRKVAGKWLIVPPPEEERFSDQERYLTGFVMMTILPPKPPKSDIPTLPSERSDAEIQKQAAEQLAMRKKDMLLAAQRLVSYSLSHDGTLPKSVAEVESNRLLRHEAVVKSGAFTMSNGEPFALNPKVFGKALDSLPKKGVVLIYVINRGKPFPDADGRYFTAVYDAKGVSVRRLTPAEARGLGL